MGIKTNNKRCSRLLRWECSYEWVDLTNKIRSPIVENIAESRLSSLRTCG